MRLKYDKKNVILSKKKHQCSIQLGSERNLIGNKMVTCKLYCLDLETKVFVSSTIDF